MILALSSIVVLAAAAGPDSASQARPIIHAIRVSEPITIDGELNEPFWHTAEAVTDFKMRDPIEGGVPSQKTEVRVGFDDDALYVGARLYDAAPESIQARLTRRDISSTSDRFGVYLDPLHDRRSGYYFIVNAAGSVLDGTLYNDGWDDGSWDGVWAGRARVDSLGWTAEMRIPYSQIRFQKGEHAVWGINFRRVIQRRSEEDYVVYQPKKASGFVSLFPDLVGLEGIQSARSIEVMPYFTSKAQYLKHRTLDPFNDGSSFKPDGGGDLRMNVGSRLTLNATVNPDFGQVEVDPAVVNLSDVESYFDEKRPFFVEGSSIFGAGQQGASDYWGFNWPEPTFFYPRRIGRTPQVMPGTDDTTFVDAPLGTRILGAAKLTGKLTPSVNFGTLHAITSKEVADVMSGHIGSRPEIEPMTYYGVTRALKEFKDRRQGFGLMTATTVRSFQDQTLRDQLNSSSILAVSDGWVFLDQKKTWVISGWSALSRVNGTEARLNDLQTNSVHYFQRPDAGGVKPRTSLTGGGMRYWLNKQNGSSFGNAAVGFMTPGLEVNDLGYQSRTDVINFHSGAGYKWTQPARHRKYQDVLGAVFGSWDFEGNRTWGGIWGGSYLQFPNNWDVNVKLSYNPQSVNDRRTRGGPLTLNRPGYEIYSYDETDPKNKLYYFVEFDRYAQPSANSWNYYVNPGVEYKPVSNLTLRIGPGYSRDHEYSQYVATLPDPSASATYGNRYVFAGLDQTTYSANIRLDVAFTPRLSFQLYAQPLIWTAKFTDFKELAAPRTYDFIGPGAGAWTYDPQAHLFDGDGGGSNYAAYNPDFNSKSLRGNAVLRWEYMPGSTLYLVWTQSRSQYETTEDFNFSRSMRVLGKAQADNIFLAKVTYYLGI
jgi:hypothetical protein